MPREFCLTNSYFIVGKCFTEYQKTPTKICTKVLSANYCGMARGKPLGIGTERKPQWLLPCKILCLLSQFQNLTVSIVIIVLISQRLFLKQKKMFQIEILYFCIFRTNLSLYSKNLLSHFKSTDFLIEVSPFCYDKLTVLVLPI